MCILICFYHTLLTNQSLCLTGAGKKGKGADSGPNADEGSSSDCLPCQQGCAYCKDDTPCVAREDGALRMAVLSFQCLCMLIVFVSMVLIYHFRRNKVGINTCSIHQQLLLIYYNLVDTVNRDRYRDIVIGIWSLTVKFFKCNSALEGTTQIEFTTTT